MGTTEVDALTPRLTTLFILDLRIPAPSLGQTPTTQRASYEYRHIVDSIREIPSRLRFPVHSARKSSRARTTIA